MQRWGGAVTPDDQWHRFDRLAWTDPAAASRQLLRLDLAHRRAGAARLALQRDDPGAPLILAQLPPELRADPALMLEEARRLRRTNQIGAALALWRGAGASAQRAAPADRLPAFWAERNLLARRLLQDGDAVGAEDLAADHGQTQPEAIADAEFLAGWIALRRLNDPDRAIPHFQRLAEISKAAITQGRAHYWLGRAQEARGDGAAAHADYAAAAAWPTTFYGQLGALALGEDPAALNARITARATADWTPAEALDVAGQELARAAILLTAWGEPYRARPFLLQLEAVAATPEQRAIAARLALGLGLPDQAVAMARRAGRDGLVLEDGWPAGLAPPGPVEAAVTLGLIRQESSFDPLALSPTGARGLMQLMPATAAEVAKRLAVQDVALSVTPDLTDPAANMRLGTAFLQGLLQRFGGSVPLALAAYNAGPNRVADWLATHGDPTQPGTGQPGATGIDMIDWIELIPFDETRNYVQRVVENIAVYRAREGVALPYPVALPPGRPAE
jgi:soluble lytic murein transglycosylase